MEDVMFLEETDPTKWPLNCPHLIAHDVGHKRDRSTAVVGSFSRFNDGILGIREFTELPQNLYGSGRASALAEVDRRYQSNSVIVTDLSNDRSYAEQLYVTFGRRVVGIQIGRFGDGTNAERRPVANGAIPVYNVGRTY